MSSADIFSHPWWFAGLQKIRERVSKKLLDGVQLSLEEVEYTDSILVSNLPPAVPEDMLTLYFESPRAGGGEVTEVIMIDPGTAKVSFRNLEGEFLCSDLGFGKHTRTSDMCVCVCSQW